jgi:hypothetical protein
MSAGRKQPYVFGGGIYIYRYSNLLINNCYFVNNFAWAGGGIYCKEAAPVISNCTFNNCKTQSSGGAMVFIFSGPIITNCNLTGNASGYNAGGVLFYESTPYVMGNNMQNNTAFNCGGAIYSEKNSTNGVSAILPLKFKRDSLFEKKELKAFSLKNTSSSYGRFLNNIICNNRAMDGGGMGFMATSPELTNNTISGNIADSACGGIYCNFSSPAVTNSIIYNNHDTRDKKQVYLVGGSSPDFKYCDIESGLIGIQKDTSCKAAYKILNITNTLPLFENPLTGKFSLTKGSKSIDAGFSDTSALKLPDTDQSGKTRIVNKIIDLGALEYTPSTSIVKNSDTLKKVMPVDPELKSAVEVPDTSGGSFSGKLDEIFTTVYPNPADGLFSVAIHNNKYNSISIRVYNQTSQLVYKNDFKAREWFEQVIDLTGMPPGIYVVVVSSKENLLYNGELVIER